MTSSGMSSPVSSLRAKQLSGRRSGRVLGRGSPRSSAPSSPASSVRSVSSWEGQTQKQLDGGSGGSANRRSPSPLATTTTYHASSSTTTESSADDRSQSPMPRRGQKERATHKDDRRKKLETKKTGGVTRGDKVEDEKDNWRPFSAPIGHAWKSYRRRRNSESSLLSSDDHRPQSGRSERSERSEKSRSIGSGLKYQTSFRDTPWTWEQLLESSDMQIGVWLKRVASSISSSSSSSSSSSWDDEVMRVTRSMSDEGYQSVRDLLQDVDETDFRSDLRSWGMRKRFLNEVMHRLQDMEEAFDVLAERGERAEEEKEEEEEGMEGMEGMKGERRRLRTAAAAAAAAGKSVAEDKDGGGGGGRNMEKVEETSQMEMRLQEPPASNTRYEDVKYDDDLPPFHVIGANKKRGLAKKTY